MDIRFPLLSILSVGFLLFFAIQGGDVTLHSLEVGFSADSQGTTITVDPAWLVWADQLYPRIWSGETFGNVAVVWKPFRGKIQGEWVKQFEINHIIQFRALGWWSYPASLFIPIDPKYHIPQNWSDPTEANDVEWLPPAGWKDIWHFISLTRLS